MIRGKTAVIGGMPILRGDHERKSSLQFIGDRNDRVAIGTARAPPGRKSF